MSDRRRTYYYSPDGDLIDITPRYVVTMPFNSSYQMVIADFVNNSTGNFSFNVTNNDGKDTVSLIRDYNTNELYIIHHGTYYLNRSYSIYTYNPTDNSITCTGSIPHNESSDYVKIGVTYSGKPINFMVDADSESVPVQYIKIDDDTRIRVSPYNSYPYILNFQVIGEYVLCSSRYQLKIVHSIDRAIKTYTFSNTWYNNYLLGSYMI